MLASFKPRGYSECIVTVGGEERVWGGRGPQQGFWEGHLNHSSCQRFKLVFWSFLTALKLVMLHVSRTAEDLNLWSIIHFLSSRKPTAAMRCMCPLYDPNRQLWIELAPLSMPRINHGVLSAGTVCGHL
jgi:hypothetical protein